MKTIQINLYKFDELPEEAQRAALDKYADINVDHDWWDSTYEDAKMIGLQITEFDLDRSRYAGGEFIEPAAEVAQNILKEHGENCRTRKTALCFLEQQAAWVREEEYDGALDDSFLNNILDDYSRTLQAESEYLQSDEAVKETLIANEYDFTIDGKIYS